MRLARAEIENFQKITVIDIVFNDRVTEISGKNAAGKSSVFVAIHTCLQQLAMPDDPIRHGTDTCAIRTHLKGDDDSILLVTKRLREDRNGKVVADLVLETPEGARYPQAATHLKQLISDHLLDPLKFLEMKQDEQLAVLKSFVVDFDFAGNKRSYDGLFAKRTEVNRDRKREQAAADSIDVLPTAPGERQDEAALTTELEDAGAKNLEIERRRTNRENAANRVQQLRTECSTSVSKCEKDEAQLRAQIADLEARILAIREALRIECAEKTEEANELQAKLDKAESLPDLVDAATISAKLNEARRLNRLIQDWETQRARKVGHQRDADAYATQSDELTAKLTELEQARQDAIRKAHLPIDGLGFGDDCVTLNGAPFKQASKGERMRTAFALVVAKQAGELKLCWISDASLLDDDNRALVEKLAEEFECQVLLETVKPGSSNAIILEDGHVQGVDLEPKLTAVTRPSSPAASNEPALATDAPAPKQRRRWQGPGASTGEAS